MNAAVAEEALVFDCKGEKLVGILHTPLQAHERMAPALAQPAEAAQATADIAVIVIVGGPQYRVGSHRQFVLLSRALARAGYPVLRFDYRGMGDSSGAARAFEQVDEDIATAIDVLLQRLPSIQRVVLWGLCDGASAALLYIQARRDIRVTGTCVLNPWVRSDESLARTHLKHYYGNRLRQPEFWRKLIDGKVKPRALWNFMINLKAAGGHRVAHAELTFQDRMASGWRDFDGSLLLLLSDNDYTAREFEEFVSTHPAWAGLMSRRALTRAHLIDADHTLSTSAARMAAEVATLRWLAQLGTRKRAESVH